jgi:hypothetical protein
MFSAVLLSMSIVAMMQFALYYWRAVISAVATQPISSRVLETVQLADSDVNGNDFEKLASWLALTPVLNAGGSGLGSVRTYFNAVRHAENVFGSIFPAIARWGRSERTLCARYAAVLIDQRLQANLAQAASMRSC